MISVGFADGHVEHTERKTEAEYELGERSINLNISGNDQDMKDYIAEELLSTKDKVSPQPSPYY